MNDASDNSKIPDTPEYWDSLAARVAATAIGESRRTGLEWLARSRAAWAAASVLIVVALVFIFTPAPKSTPSDRGALWSAALTPSDGLAKQMVVPDGPPSIGLLLLPPDRTR